MSPRRIWLAWTLLLVPAFTLLAQDPTPFADELRFVRELRARRFNDLALEYLLRLEKTASAALKKELPLEIAKTRLEAAADEPDVAKRLAQYQESQAALKKFLAENKGHPRSAEVKVDIARVGVLRGRTELSRAWLQDTTEARVEEGLKARATFAEAAKDLQAAVTELGVEYDLAKDGKSPEEQSRAKQLQEALQQAELEKALNQFDQASSLLDEGKDAVLKERGRLMEQAQKALEKVGAGDDTSPVSWQARAWAARCYHELGVPKTARQRFNEILGAPARVAGEGQRLARYFRLLVISDAPDPSVDKDPAGIILEAGNRWLVDYPAYSKSTEAMGLRYLLARTHIGRSKDKGYKATQQQRDQHLVIARRLLHDVESTENEFTERARRLKIAIVGEQGGFKKDIASLNNYEDCFIRAQYEMYQANEDAEKLKGEELEAKRKERQANVLQAFQRGLAMKTKGPDGKERPVEELTTLEVNNAKLVLTFYCLNAGKYKEAVQVGEKFARFDPRSSQAAMAAVYALQAYSQLPEEKEKMQSLAKYMKERWPKELAGNVARHQLGLLAVRDKNIPLAVQELSGITPEYPSYTVSQYQLAEACSQAERDQLEPIDDYRKKAVAALTSIPELPAGGSDFTTNRMYVLARIKLLGEWFKTKQFKEMDELSTKLLALTTTLKFDDDKAKDEEMQAYFRTALGDMQLYALYGQAQAEFDKNNHNGVVTILDKLIDDANAAVGKMEPHQVVKNQQLGNVLLSMALRSNIQLNKLDRAKLVIPLLQELTKQAGGQAGTTTILRQLQAIVARQIEELGKKKDEATLAKTRAGFTAILDDLTKREEKPSADFTFALAQNYALMGEHKKAANVLEKMPAPAADDMQAVKLNQAARLLYIRMLRLAGEVDKARPILFDEVIGKDNKGWGARNIDALKEKVFLLEADGNYVAAAQQANMLVSNLVKRADADNALKEQYLECYYHVVYCFLMHGKNQTDEKLRTKFITDAANQILALEKRWMGFGSEVSEKRFTELLEKEQQLAEVYKTIKDAAAAGAASGGR